MIKIKVFILSALLVFAFAGMVFAADGAKAPDNRPDRTEKVTGDDIEIGDGEHYQKKDSEPIMSGILAGVLLIAGAGLIAKKKKA